MFTLSNISLISTLLITPLQFLSDKGLTVAHMSNGKMTGICDYCKLLTLDILTGSTSANDRWQAVVSSYATLSFTTHLDGDIDTQHQSAANGCQMCKTTADKTRTSENPHFDSKYHIFVFAKARSKYQFQIATGNVEAFTKHFSKRQMPQTLSFFSQLVSEVNLQSLGSSETIENASRPILPFLPHCNPASIEALKQAKLWLVECQNNHWECSRPRSTLPKRVLDLEESANDARVSLYVTNGEILPYAALSYSWGETDKITLKKNSVLDSQAARFEDYPYHILRRKPQFRDAQGKMCFDSAFCIDQIKFQ